MRKVGISNRYSYPLSFAQREPEALAGILGAGVSAPGEGAQPSPKTHASPARSAQSNPVEE